MPEHAFTNRLINEKSPYLLQHAHNPVDWFPWGDEAFDKAKKEDKPLFVSIGYASCHWCHVMENESFEDEEVAKILNEYFVSIKVDREERADIDAAYMAACEVLGSNGGWPLNVFINNDGSPFFAGTYFPKEDKYNMAGFITVLKLISNFWNEDREKLLSAGKKVADIIEQKSKPSEIKESWLHDAASIAKRAFDDRYGGFAGAPKFPMPSTWLFLLRYSDFYDDREALSITINTLNKMAMGGIYDHVEGGFCRYSTDESWTVPHFEKMLYDNAQLLELYAEAYAKTGDSAYKIICEQIIAYLFRNLKNKDGAFYTSMDADSAGVEGDYYVFSMSEIKSALPEDLLSSFLKVYPVSKEGNFEGKNVLVANSLSQDAAVIKALETLKKEREKRVKPGLDDKILSGQNGLIISALAKAGRIFKEEAYISAAKRAADFVLEKMVIEGRLMSSYREGLSPHKSVQPDYAYFINGLIELYKATLGDAYLLNAITLTEGMLKLFWDEQSGGFYMTGNDTAKLYVGIKEKRDGVVPSGNAVAANVLFVLSRLCANIEYEQRAIKTLESVASSINSQPLTYTAHLLTQIYMQSENVDVILTEGKGIDEMKKCVIYNYQPYVHAILCNEQLKQALTYLHSYNIEENAAAYVCKNETCSSAITNISDLEKAIMS